MSQSARIDACYFGGDCEQPATHVTVHVERWDVGSNPPVITVRGVCSMHYDHLAASESRQVSGWPTQPEVLVVGPALTTHGQGTLYRYLNGAEREIHPIA